MDCKEIDMRRRSRIPVPVKQSFISTVGNPSRMPPKSLVKNAFSHNPQMQKPVLDTRNPTAKAARNLNDSSKQKVVQNTKSFASTKEPCHINRTLTNVTKKAANKVLTITKSERLVNFKPNKIQNKQTLVENDLLARSRTSNYSGPSIQKKVVSFLENNSCSPKSTNDAKENHILQPNIEFVADETCRKQILFGQGITPNFKSKQIKVTKTNERQSLQVLPKTLLDKLEEGRRISVMRRPSQSLQPAKWDPYENVLRNLENVDLAAEDRRVSAMKSNNAFFGSQQKPFETVLKALEKADLPAEDRRVSAMRSKNIPFGSPGTRPKKNPFETVLKQIEALEAKNRAKGGAKRVTFDLPPPLDSTFTIEKSPKRFPTTPAPKRRVFKEPSSAPQRVPPLSSDSTGWSSPVLPFRPCRHSSPADQDVVQRQEADTTPELPPLPAISGRPKVTFKEDRSPSPPPPPERAGASDRPPRAEDLTPPRPEFEPLHLKKFKTGNAEVGPEGERRAFLRPHPSGRSTDVVSRLQDRRSTLAASVRTQSSALSIKYKDAMNWLEARRSTLSAVGAWSSALPDMPFRWDSPCIPSPEVMHGRRGPLSGAPIANMEEVAHRLDFDSEEEEAFPVPQISIVLPPRGPVPQVSKFKWSGLREADEECKAILSVAAFPFLTTRNYWNPVAHTLTHGDDMHFVPLRKS